MMSVRTLIGATIIGVSAMVLPCALSAQDAPIVNGEVLRVDLHSGMITIKHGPIQNLAMNAAGATDDFKVAEPIFLNALQPGETIKFTADRVDGQLRITRLQPG
jgi:Cu/Ag efflux protein CusF